MNGRDRDDLPAAEPLFSIDRLATTLARTLQREREAAFVLGIHGAWGSGKTTLLNAIRARLPQSAVLIDFNAWKYQNKEALWRALILRVLAELRRQGGDEKKIEELERSLYEGFTAIDRGPLQVNWTAAVAEAIQVLISLAAVGAGVGFLGGAAGFFAKWFGQKQGAEGKAEDTAKRVERAAGILQRKTIEHAVQHVESIEQFLTTFQELVSDLTTVRRIYVLIDDLDRCLPDSALEIFEAMKLFLDAPECAYVLAVDRAVIRRGLELRYPLPPPTQPARVLPPIIDPDEYIEKTITLSIDMPMFARADGRALLATADITEPFSLEEANTIIDVLGTNPRRLKRFGAMLALWREVARSLEGAAQPALGFSPLKPENRPLFVKLGLIGYLNSAVFAQMQRDPDLPARLQAVCNNVFDVNGKLKTGAAKTISGSVENELPVVAQASLEPALWRALQLEPKLTVEPEKVNTALRWFRSAAG